MAGVTGVNCKNMTKNIAVFIVFLFMCFCVRASDVPKQWNDLEHEYKTLMSVFEHSRAAKLAGEMLLLDPSSNKARFYLAYAHKKSNTPPPNWLFLEPWSEGSVEDKFYKLLASDLANGS